MLIQNVVAVMMVVQKFSAAISVLVLIFSSEQSSLHLVRGFLPILRARASET